MEAGVDIAHLNMSMYQEEGRFKIMVVVVVVEEASLRVDYRDKEAAKVTI